MFDVNVVTAAGASVPTGIPPKLRKRGPEPAKLKNVEILLAVAGLTAVLLPPSRTPPASQHQQNEKSERFFPTRYLRVARASGQKYSGIILNGS